jgi:hypothetical protein
MIMVSGSSVFDNRLPRSAVSAPEGLRSSSFSDAGEKRVSQMMNPVAGQISSTGQCSRMRASPVAIVMRFNPVAPLSIVEFAP